MMDTCRLEQMLSEARRRYRRENTDIRAGEVQKRREGPGLSWEEAPQLRAQDRERGLGAGTVLRPRAGQATEMSAGKGKCVKSR